MKKILLVLEQGNNHGHAAIMSQMAALLMRAGHEVMVCGPAHELASPPFAKVPYRLVPAPVSRLGRSARPVFSWASLATVLWDLGLARTDQTPAIFEAWRAIYRETQPDAIVFNAAPFAQLAAIGLAGVTRVQIGLPYGIVPPVSPIPPYRYWTRIPKAQAQDFEARLQAAVTQALGVPNRYACLGELLDTDASFVTSVPELEPYGTAGRIYTGPTPIPDNGRPVDWQTGGRKALAYVRAQHVNVERIGQALQERYDEVIIACPDATAQLVDRFNGQGGRVRLHKDFIDIKRLIPDCHLVVSHAGGLLVHGLIHGKAQVVLPTQFEQLVSARLLAEKGLGVMALPTDPRACRQAIGLAARPGFLDAKLADAAKRYADMAARPGEKILEAFSGVLG